MNGPEIPPLANARIDWSTGEPWSPDFQDVYFSRAGGLDETQHVFLQGNELEERWRERDADGGVFVIGELGFGTGLNFLATWRLWQQSACQRLRLHYISCEQFPLRREDLERALAQWPELAPLSTHLLEQYPDHSPGIHRLLLSDGTGSEVTLDLYYGDAAELLSAPGNEQAGVDAWYLDGFTPKHNPELWTGQLLNAIRQLSRPGATVASYSVTGRVVRALQALGFTVEKRKGFAHKRHMLHAHLPVSGPDGQADGNGNADAAEREPDCPQARRAIVVGAGLSGASVAWSLAQRGWYVQVLESEPDVASGASGNPQAVLQCRLNRQPDALWQLNLLSFLHASRFYGLLQATGHHIDWHRCGVLTLDGAYRNTRKAPAPGSYDHYSREVLQRVSAQEAGEIAGTALSEAGLFLPDGGWLNPARLCHALLDHPGITVQTGVRVDQLQHEDGLWHLHTTGAGTGEHVAPVVVLANSHSVRHLPGMEALPVLPLRGQISRIDADAQTRSLQTVICGKSYLAPSSSAGDHCAGASYRKQRSDTALSDEEHNEVMEGIRPFLPDIDCLSDPRASQPLRASVRGSSGDFVPLAGGVPDLQPGPGLYGGALHPGRDSTPPPHYLPGLYINAGHGSHGMAGCPLAAEHIASLVSGEPSPLPKHCAELLDPARFERRRLRRAMSQGPSEKKGCSAR